MLGIGELGRGGAVQGLRALGVLVIILSRKTHHLKKKKYDPLWNLRVTESPWCVI